MSIISLLLLLLPLSLSQTPLSLLVITDIHLNPLYDGAYDYTTNCMSGPVVTLKPEISTILSHLDLSSSSFSSYSKYGCDPSEKLTSIILDEAQKRNPNPDIIFLAGDFIAHGFSQDASKQVNNKTFNELIDIHRQAMQVIRGRFGNSLILPTVGNNDNELHYEVPGVREKGGWYDFLYELWFEESQSTIIQQNLGRIRETFFNGGYYRLDINGQLSVVGLNTLYYSKKNYAENDPVAANDQLDWLTNVLEDIKNNEPLRKIIFTCHVQPGYKYEGSATREWNDTFVQKFNDILLNYDDQIVGGICSHTHLSSVRSFKSKASIQNAVKSLKNNKVALKVVNAKTYGATLISPSITTIDYSNPGVSFVEVDIKTERYIFKNMKYLYLNLEKLNNDPNSEKITNFTPFFFEIDINNQFGLSDLSASSIDGFINNLSNDDDLLRNYLAATVGYPNEEPYFTKAMNIFVGFGLIKDISTLKISSSEKQQYFCIMKNLIQQDYIDCKAAAA